MNQCNLTVFTPTYNRADTLVRLYESLLNQTFKNFEWVIVDDGSDDNTEDVISDLQHKADFKIHYIKQENGGKHRAINSGAKLATGELFFIVDSDDYLLVSSLDLIMDCWNSVDDKTKFAGVAGLKVYIDGNNVGDKLKYSTLDCSIIERRYIYGINGDMAEVFRTSIIKEYPFPDFKNEKFCAEGLIWNRISLKYKLRFFNKPIYICEYLQGGLSQNSIRNRRKNSNYTLLLYSELSKNRQVPFFFKIRALINFWRFSFVNSKSFGEKLNMLDMFLLGFLAMPIGFILNLKDYYFSDVKINN